MFLPFLGVLRAKNGPKTLLFAYIRGKEGPFISRTGFSALNIAIRILYCELGKKPHLGLSCGRRGRQDTGIKCGFFPTRFWTARSESVGKKSCMVAETRFRSQIYAFLSQFWDPH